MTTLIRLPRMGLRLGGFIAASLAAHWLVLAGWVDSETYSALDATAPMAVQLLPVEESRQMAQSEPLVGQKKAQDVSAQSPAPTTLEQAVAIATETADTQSPTEPSVDWTEPHVESGIEVVNAQISQAAPRAITYAEALEGIRNRLKDDLARHFKYPRLAKMRSWEGTVLLDLQIETDGKISRVTLAQSSGYAMLDNNAIATFNRIGNVRGAQQWLEGGNMELQLPVIYRLSDS